MPDGLINILSGFTRISDHDEGPGLDAVSLGQTDHIPYLLYFHPPVHQVDDLLRAAFGSDPYTETPAFLQVTDHVLIHAVGSRNAFIGRHQVPLHHFLCKSLQPFVADRKNIVHKPEAVHFIMLSDPTDLIRHICRAPPPVTLSVYRPAAPTTAIGTSSHSADRYGA